jgi:hypothetical protein
MILDSFIPVHLYLDVSIGLSRKSTRFRKHASRIIHYMWRSLTWLSNSQLPLLLLLLFLVLTYIESFPSEVWTAWRCLLIRLTVIVWGRIYLLNRLNSSIGVESGTLHSIFNLLSLISLVIEVVWGHCKLLPSVALRFQILAVTIGILTFKLLIPWIGSIVYYYTSVLLITLEAGLFVEAIFVIDTVLSCILLSRLRITIWRALILANYVQSLIWAGVEVLKGFSEVHELRSVHRTRLFLSHLEMEFALQIPIRIVLLICL